MVFFVFWGENSEKIINLSRTGAGQAPIDGGVDLRVEGVEVEEKCVHNRQRTLL